jgi:hypothetical protein
MFYSPKMQPIPATVLQEIEASAVSEISFAREIPEDKLMEQFNLYQFEKLVGPELVEIRNLVADGRMRTALQRLERILGEYTPVPCHKLTEFC